MGLAARKLVGESLSCSAPLNPRASFLWLLPLENLRRREDADSENGAGWNLLFIHAFYQKIRR